MQPTPLEESRAVRINPTPTAVVSLKTVTVQALMDTIAGKPGATLEDVAATIAALSLAGGGPITTIDGGTP